MEKLNVLRHLIKELRHLSASGKMKESLPMQYIFSQYRKYQTTDQQLCKAQEEMDFMARTYLCYLSSTRKHLEISEAFKGKGERSVAETANIVGFKLPHDPK